MGDTGRFGQMAAEILHNARARSGLTLRELASRAGTSHATVHAYETGAKTPSVATFLRLLDACGFAVGFDLAPRIRWQDGIYRGDELAEVLKLAQAFPSKARRHMDFPRFGSGDGPR